MLRSGDDRVCERIRIAGTRIDIYDWEDEAEKIADAIYEMIRYACETGRGFDFEGSMVKEIAEHNRRFGADLTRYYRIPKDSDEKHIEKDSIGSL